VNVYDFGPRESPVDLTEIRQEIAAMPTISEISAMLKDAFAKQSWNSSSQVDTRLESPQISSVEQIDTRLEVALESASTSVPPPTDYAVFSPHSIGSQCLSQVDSGFGSPGLFSMNEEGYNGDIETDNEGDISGVEPFGDFHDILANDDREDAPEGKMQELWRVFCMRFSRFVLLHHRRCHPLYMPSSPSRSPSFCLHAASVAVASFALTVIILIVFLNVNTFVFCF